MDLNKAIICGRLTRDPQGTMTGNGVPVTSFSVASNRRWIRDGETQEETEYHNVVVFGKQGESCAAHLRKGNTALVEGHLKTRAWEHEGVKHYRTEIIADRVIFGPRSVSSEEAPETGPTTPHPTHPTAQHPKTAGSVTNPPAYPTENLDPADIPF